MRRKTGNTIVVEADVEGERELIAAETIEPGSDVRRLRHCGTANDHARYAGFKHALDRLRIPKAAADLQFQASQFRQSFGDGHIAANPVLGAVEVDHVQPVRAQVKVASSERQGLHRIACLGVEITLVEAHATSGFQIDCRY